MIPYQVLFYNGERVKVEKMEYPNLENGLQDGEFLIVTNTGEVIFLSGGAWFTNPDGFPEYRVSAPEPPKE